MRCVSADKFSAYSISVEMCRSTMAARHLEPVTRLRIGHQTTSANERHETVGTNENALRKCCARIRLPGGQHLTANISHKPHATRYIVDFTSTSRGKAPLASQQTHTCPYLRIPEKRPPENPRYISARVQQWWPSRTVSGFLLGSAAVAAGQ